AVFEAICSPNAGYLPATGLTGASDGQCRAPQNPAAARCGRRKSGPAAKLPIRYVDFSGALDVPAQMPAFKTGSGLPPDNGRGVEIPDRPARTALIASGAARTPLI